MEKIENHRDCYLICNIQVEESYRVLADADEMSPMVDNMVIRIVKNIGSEQITEPRFYCMDHQVVVDIGDYNYEWDY